MKKGNLFLTGGNCFVTKMLHKVTQLHPKLNRPQVCCRVNLQQSHIIICFVGLLQERERGGGMYGGMSFCQTFFSPTEKLRSCSQTLTAHYACRDADLKLTLVTDFFFK